jgi:hypothetical protein
MEALIGCYKLQLNPRIKGKSLRKATQMDILNRIVLLKIII